MDNATYENLGRQLGDQIMADGIIDAAEFMQIETHPHAHHAHWRFGVLNRIEEGGGHEPQEGNIDDRWAHFIQTQQEKHRRHDFSTGQPYPGSWSSSSQLALLMMKNGNPWLSNVQLTAMMKGNPNAKAEVTQALRKSMFEHAMRGRERVYRYNPAMARKIFTGGTGGKPMTDNTWEALKWMIKTDDWLTAETANQLGINKTAAHKAAGTMAPLLNALRDRFLNGSLNWGHRFGQYGAKSVDLLVRKDDNSGWPIKINPEHLEDLRLLTGIQQDPDYAAVPKVGEYFLDNRYDPPILVVCTRALLKKKKRK